jgi:hypothetical protein
MAGLWVFGVPAGEYSVFVASEASGFGLPRGVVAGGPSPTVTLTPGARVRLQVRDEAGQPLMQTPVEVDLRTWNGTAVSIERVSSYSRTASTDDQGFVEMAVPAGHVTLKGRTRDFSRTGTLEVATREGVTGRLTLAPVPR